MTNKTDISNNGEKDLEKLGDGGKKKKDNIHPKSKLCGEEGQR